MSINFSVTPIAGSSVAWTVFLKDTTDLIGHTLTRGADSSGLKLSDCARYILALSEFHTKKESNPVDTLQQAGALLRHLHFSFLITGPTVLIFKISELTKLDILSTRLSEGKGRVALVSGVLEEWKSALAELYQYPSLRQVTEALLGYFNHYGLHYVFSGRNSLNGWKGLSGCTDKTLNSNTR